MVPCLGFTDQLVEGTVVASMQSVTRRGSPITRNHTPCVIASTMVRLDRTWSILLMINFILFNTCTCQEATGNDDVIKDSPENSFVPDIASHLKYALDDTILYAINWISKPGSLPDASLTKQVEGPSTAAVGNNEVTTSLPSPQREQPAVHQMNDKLKSVIEAAEIGVPPDIFTLNEESEKQEPLNMVTENENYLWIKTNRQETYYCVLPIIKSGPVTSLDLALAKREGSTVDKITQVKPELTNENTANAPATTTTSPAVTNKPRSGSTDSSDDDDDDDPFGEKESPYALLKSLFNREMCSLRLDHYWTYELCHGRYLRQFHEPSVIHKAKPQEYHLGRYSMADFEKTEAQFMAKIKKYKSEGKKLPSVIVEGTSMPYIEFNYTGGTLCNLNNRERVTRVLYVCSENSKHELHSVKEIFTCEYEAIVLSPILCLHEDFKVSQDKEHQTKCYPVGPSTNGKPEDLAKFDDELVEQIAKVKANSKENSIYEGKTIIFETPYVGSSGLKLSYQFTINDPEEALDRLTDPDSETQIPKTPTSKSSKGPILNSYKQNPNSPSFQIADDSTLTAEFLSGDLCLQGGTGWWKYEFCYGKHVEQYHEEKGVRTTVIRLGNWIPDNHIKWLEKHPEKKPAQGKTPKQVSNYYSQGDPCADSGGKARHVEVKLKCKIMPNAQSDSVAIYLIEPQTCEYILGVESPILCRLLSSVDENGLIENN